MKQNKFPRVLLRFLVVCYLEYILHAKMNSPIEPWSHYEKNKKEDSSYSVVLVNFC